MGFRGFCIFAIIATALATASVACEPPSDPEPTVVSALPSPTPAATETPAPTATPSPIREALTALYNATNGDNWTNSDVWLTDTPIETWRGVSVDDYGYITLFLSDNNLSGEIPPEIANLTNLRQGNRI